MKNLFIQRTLLVMIVIVIVALGGYYVLFHIIKQTNEKTSELAKEIEQYTEQAEVLRSADKVADALQEDIEKINSYFLGKEQVVSFIETVESAGEKSGVTVTISSVGVGGAGGVIVASGQKPAPKPTAQLATTSTQSLTPETLSLRADVRGSWSGVLQFMSYMENVPYKLSLNRVSVGRVSTVASFFKPSQLSTEDEPDGPVWTASFEINVLTL